MSRVHFVLFSILQNIQIRILSSESQCSSVNKNQFDLFYTVFDSIPQAVFYWFLWYYMCYYATIKQLSVTGE